MNINQIGKGQKTEEAKRLSVRLPPKLYRMVADTAEMENLSINWWLVKTLDAVFSNVRLIDVTNPYWVYGKAFEHRKE